MAKHSDEEMEKLVKEGIPDTSKHSGSIKALKYLIEVVEPRLHKSPDPLQHLYHYLKASICGLVNHIEECKGRHLTPEELHSIITLAFDLGRLRESDIGLLEELKAKCVKEFGLLTKEDLEEAEDSKAYPVVEGLVERLRRSGVRVQVLDLSDLLHRK